MIAQICPVCGNTPHEAREWRRCPKMDNQLICGSEHCKVCEYWRKEEDKGTLWCTYHHGRTDSQKVDIPALERQIAYKRELKDKYYRQNKPKVAEQIEWEVLGLQKKLRGQKSEIHIT